ncbi:hypothetical protein [Teichococcus vastitatis]|uniref:Transcriptional regulator n=1 Tax=Teichococcus vastitatis TaxID=2307076 RepID=A0ABS9W437_9PROT|nr:hypothetical protein [Pseudoroseomonas vastitatis]MCI0754040.1 hypothetical protein [Pseudoroseomonas vastitatis]
MSVAAGATRPPRPVRVGPRDQALRRLRTCYDHLAGRIAVAMADRMVERRELEITADGGRLTESGAAFLDTLGVTLRPGAPEGPRGRIFCRPCVDWSERRPHIAGALGAALCECCVRHNWVRRQEGSRALAITPAGDRALREFFGLDAG